MVCIDAHAHLALRPGATQRLLESMDKLKVARTFVVGGGLIEPRELSRRIHGDVLGASDVQFDNAALLQECRAHGDRLAPFFFANPWRGPEEYSEIGAAFHGLKLAPAVHGMPLDEARHHALIDVAADHGHPVYLHCLAQSGFQVEDLVSVAARHPSVTFILGHAGIGNMDFVAVDLIEARSNILFETSGGFSAVIVHAVKTLGAGRVLFGSEYPLQDPAAELVKIDNLPLPSQDIDLIRGGNAQALMAGARHVR